MQKKMQKKIREKIYIMVISPDHPNRLSKLYNILMLFLIVLSILPLTVKNYTDTLRIIDSITVLIFIVDYILRLSTADYAMKGKGPMAFFLYALTPLALIDLLSILTGITVLNNRLRLLKILRLLRAWRVFRVFKIIRYSKNLERIFNIFRRQKQALTAVCLLVLTYLLVSALVIFNVEPNTFETFFDAVYWATISLTTVGYGDIYPVTRIGQTVTMISSIMGIVVVALPAGMITAGYMEELRLEREEHEKSDKKSTQKE